MSPNGKRSPALCPVGEDRERLSDLIESDPNSEILQLYRLVDGRPYQLVLAPVLGPNTIGWAAMGFALDGAVAADMSRLLGVDVSFVAADGEQSPPYVATSVPNAERRGFGARNGAPAATPFFVTAGNDKILTWTNPIRSANGHLTLVLQRSLASALRPYQDVRNSVLAIGMVLLAIASILAVWLSRSATRPVEDLTQAAERLEAGDYTVEVPRSGTTGSEVWRALFRLCAGRWPTGRQPFGTRPLMTH